MTITLCCGHKVDDFDDVVRLSMKEYAPDYSIDELVRAISYGGYCKECAARYEKWNMVLRNEQEEKDWLSGKMPDTEQQ